MKKTVLFLLAACITIGSFAQEKPPVEEGDTVRIGQMIIIKKKGENKEIITQDNDVTAEINRKKTFTTNWLVFDIGFSNVIDNTVYPNTGGMVDASLATKSDLRYRTGKSRNVNIWLVMQRLNIAKSVVNLKYGLGLELNNYYFQDGIEMQKQMPYIIPATNDYKKAKLAADYVTVPLMLNFNFTPGKHRPIGFSAGISGGLLYSSRFKTKLNSDKNKIHDEFDLEQLKLSYIGELLLGPVTVYGSYASKSMWTQGLDQVPYTVGLRFTAN